MISQIYTCKIYQDSMIHLYSQKRILNTEESIIAIIMMIIMGVIDHTIVEIQRDWDVTFWLDELNNGFDLLFNFPKLGA